MDDPAKHDVTGRDLTGADALFFFTGDAGATRITGAQIAETGFLHALARHAGLRRLRVVARDASRFGDVPGCEILPLAAMPAAIADDPPDCAFAPFALMAPLAHLRDRAPRGFPILGFVHSLTGAEIKSSLARTLQSRRHGGDVALCPSPAAARALASILHEIAEDFPTLPLARPAIHHCPLGLEIDAFATPDREAARAALGLGDAVVFAAIGRLSPASKMDLLPLLLAFARAKVAPARLVIAGQDQFPGYRDLLTARAHALGIADRVTFVLDDDRPAIMTVFAAADVLVSPSDNVQESFGLTLVEALAAGLPVIASDWDGYPAILGNSGAAILIPTIAAPPAPDLVAEAPFHPWRTVAMHGAQTVAVDMTSLTRAIAALASDAPRRAAMASAARVAAARFAWPAVIAQVAERAAAAIRDYVPGPPAPGLSAYRFDTGRHFAHYASRAWTAPLRLHRVAAPGADTLLPWLARQAALPWPVIAALIEEAADSRPLTVTPDAGDRARAAMFLMKHGLLAEVGG